MKQPVALSIAGSDPSGGAGIQADLKTFHQFGLYGEAVITLLTVQNTRAVTRVELLDPDLVEQQVRAVLEDIPPAAIKTGALGRATVVLRLAWLAPLFRCPLVVDPILLSTLGAPLLAEEARTALLEYLLPRATLITPNLQEAAALTGLPVANVQSMREAARRLGERTGAAVLVKGGHLEGDAVDILWDGVSFREYRAPRVETVHTHGTGCTYSAAITALLALAHPLPEAVARAKAFITEAIRTSPGLGGGSGPVNHHARPLQ
ncbi:MAG: bifunctional hydroxymethylpyrimidine kinase/phosphomethylpyrimidine kinase [Bryobacteraceae bacterium]